MTSGGHGTGGLCCGGCSKLRARAGSWREWVQELQSPDPSQLLLGTAPGSPGEGQTPGWHQAASAQLQDRQVWGFHSPGTQQCCSQGPLKLGFWDCIWEINHTKVFMGCHKLWVTKLNIQVVCSLQTPWLREIPSQYCPWLQPQLRVTCPGQLFQNLLWFTPC